MIGAVEQPGQYGGEMNGRDSRQEAQNIPGESSKERAPQIGQMNGTAEDRQEKRKERVPGIMTRPQRFFE